MIRYLADSTAVWRLQCDRKLNDLWGHELDEGAIGSCAPQRPAETGTALGQAQGAGGQLRSATSATCWSSSRVAPLAAWTAMPCATAMR